MNALYRDLIKAGYEAKTARALMRALQLAATGAGGAGLALQLKAILQNLDNPESLKSALISAFFLWTSHARPQAAGEPKEHEPSGPKPGKLPTAIVVTRQWAGKTAGLIRTMHDLLTRLGFENLAKQFETELAIWADACAKPPKADEVRANH